MKRLFLTWLLLAGTALPASAIEPVGSVATLFGKVSLERNGKSYLLTQGLKLYNGDAIIAADDAFAKLLLKDESLLTVGENSTFKLENVHSDAGSRFGQFRLMFGKVRAIVSKFGAGKTDYRFVTPTAVAGVRGTHLVVEFDAATRQTVVSVIEGSVAFKAFETTGGGSEVLIGAQYRSEQKSGAPAGEPTKMSSEEMQRLDTEISKQTPKANDENTPAEKTPNKGTPPANGDKQDEPAGDQEGRVDDKLERVEQAVDTPPTSTQQENPAVNPATQTGVRVRW